MPDLISFTPGAQNEHTCTECGEKFFNTRQHTVMYCSQKCRTRAYRRRKKQGIELVKPKPKGRKLNTANYQKRRRDLINAYKVEKGCARCGYNEHPAALDFNHIDPSTKSFNISQDPKKKWSEIQAEVAKCEVLCANCHRIHTHEEQHNHTARKSA